MDLVLNYFSFSNPHMNPSQCGSSLLKEANRHTFRTIPQEHWSLGMSMARPS